MSIRAKSSFESLQYIKEQLNQYQQLFFTRFGDGEVIAMQGEEHRNYHTSPGLVKELKESFTINHPRYLIALSVNFPYEKKMAPGIFAPYPQNNELLHYLEKSNLLIHQVYESHFVFHYLAVFYPKIMNGFLNTYIRPRKKMFIGSTPHKTAEKLYGPIAVYVNIPVRHAYDTIDDWWPAIRDQIEQVDLVIPSAGAASNIISKRLWNMDAKVHLIDIGSIVDALEEKQSRIWIRLQGYKIKRILPETYRNEIFTNIFQNIIHEIKYLFRLYVKRYL
ncbi:MAG: hypothetical protein ACOCXD_00195 [Bacteroidota bacterium]